MATDPTQSITTERQETPLVTRARGALRRLAELPPSLDVPYLTVTMDWQVAGESPAREDPDEVRRSEERDAQQESVSRRPGRLVFEQQVNDLIAAQEPRGATLESLTADADRVRQYIAAELDPAAQGVMVVANSAQGVFEALAFALPLPTKVSLGPEPVLHDVAALIEDNPTYAVLLADQKNATLSLIKYGQTSRRTDIVGSGYPRHQQQGGWSQRRYQARADERIEAFAGDVAEETRKVLDQLDVRMLIVAGDEVITPVLDAAFHETVTERIIDHIHMDIRATEQEIIDATLPIAEQAQRDREKELVGTLKDQVGSDAKGVAGGEGTLEALQAGQVMSLLMVDTYSEDGWADYTLPFYGVGHPPEEHPAGGDVANIVPIKLEEALIRLALQQDAEIEFIHSRTPVGEEELEHVPDAGSPLPITEAAAGLQELGGVGAILRFTLDAAPPESV